MPKARSPHAAKSLDTVVSQILRAAFFRRDPPKTAGREQFGREFVKYFLQKCGKAREEDIVATATALTSWSIGAAVRLLTERQREQRYHDFLVSGGGAKNPTLMRMIEEELAPYKLRVQKTDNLGLPLRSQRSRRIRHPRLPDLAKTARKMSPVPPIASKPADPRESLLCVVAAWLTCDLPCSRLNFCSLISTSCSQ